MLSATYRDERTVSLAWALAAGPWWPFAELSLEEAAVDGPDAPVSFDPVRNVLPGLEVYPWVRRLREPSYATARGSRRP